MNTLSSVVRLLLREVSEPLGRVDLIACAMYWLFVYWLDGRVTSDLERAKLVMNLSLGHGEMITWLERREAMVLVYVGLFAILLFSSLLLLASNRPVPGSRHMWRRR